jgi:hypothetical protein
MAASTLWETDIRFPAYRWLLKYPKIMHDVELGKPPMLPERVGISQEITTA